MVACSNDPDAPASREGKTRQDRHHRAKKRGGPPTAPWADRVDEQRGDGLVAEKGVDPIVQREKKSTHTTSLSLTLTHTPTHTHAQIHTHIYSLTPPHTPHMLSKTDIPR